MDIGDRACVTAKKILQKYKVKKLIINDIVEDELKKSYRKLKMKNTELFIGDATKTKFENNSIDRIIVQFVLNELIGDLKQAFIEWKRILKKDGIIIVSEHFLNPKLKQDKAFLECFGNFHEKNISLKAVSYTHLTLPTILLV